MCGISGVYKFNNSGTVSDRELSGMRDTLVHRGPDGGANYVSPDKKIGLSQRRLAIIDLSKEAACPMGNEDGTVWITYNGEIYNFKPLREELIKKGHKMKTHGDTEVILHGYEEWGEEIAKKLNGMFAFVIWDENKKLFFAARDHLGIKPFYYAVQNGTFYFGSELKAILAHPAFRKELSETAFSQYLTYSSVPAPLTMFEDIKKLPAAHCLTVRKGQIEIKEFWNPLTESSLRYGANPLTESDYLEKVKDILKDSIKSQMISDVPFGCFLSGGIDSSTNAALMTEALGHPVETFSAGSHHEKYNEFTYSRKMAEFLGAKSHEVAVDENDLLKFLEKYPYHADDLNGDYICFPMYYLSELTRKNGVIVVQIGEGSDEIFAGYSTYLLANKLYERWWRHLRRLPEWMRKGIYGLSNLAPSHKLDFQKEYLRRLSAGQEPFWGLAVAFSDHQKERMLTPQFKSRVPLSVGYEPVKKHYADVASVTPGADFLTKMTYLEIKHRLPELLLARADRMTMAHSVEGRVPFLDRRLVELTLSIPTSIKFKDNEPKYVLKKAMEGTLPAEIIRRPKQGFSTPMNEWLRMDFPIGREILGRIGRSGLKERGLLDYDYVNSFVATDRHEDNGHIFRLWNLVSLSLWYDRWFS